MSQTLHYGNIEFIIPDSFDIDIVGMIQAATTDGKLIVTPRQSIEDARIVFRKTHKSRFDNGLDVYPDVDANEILNRTGIGK